MFTTVPDPRNKGKLLTKNNPEQNNLIVPWSPPATQEIPLEIVYATPHKKNEIQRPIVVVFNQPMVTLGPVKSHAEDPSRFPIRVEPPIKASYRWISSDILKVTPQLLEGAFLPATRYTVTIPASTEAVSGSRLNKDFSFSFETLRPEVNDIQIIPQDKTRADRLLPTDKFQVYFNMDISSQGIKKLISLRADEKILPFRIEFDEREKDRLSIIPKEELPAGALVKIRVSVGVRGEVGPLTSKKPYTFEKKTVSKLQVSFRCLSPRGKDKTVCRPMENAHHKGLRILFSEPVSRKQLNSHLSFYPPIPNLKKMLAHDSESYYVPSSKGGFSRSWFLKGNIAPNQEYRVRVNPGLRDIFGGRIRKAVRWSFTTTSFPPDLFLPQGGEGVREVWQTYPVEAVNANSVEVRNRSYRGREMISFLRCVHKNRSQWPQKCTSFPKKPNTILSVQGPKDQIRKKSLTLPLGLTALSFQSPQVLDHRDKPIKFFRFSTRTNLGIHARMSPFGVVVWITTLSTGRAQKNVHISIFDHNEELLASGLTDHQGFFESNNQLLVKRLNRKRPPLIYVMAQKADDTGYVVLKDTNSRHDKQRDEHEYPYRHCMRYDCLIEPILSDLNNTSYIHRPFVYTGHWDGERQQLVGYLSTESSIYRPGQTVHFHGAVRVYRTWRGKPVEGKTVQVELLDDRGTKLQTIKVKTGRFGVFLSNLQLPDKHRLGRYTIRLYLDTNPIARHNFRVAEYRAPRFRTLLHMSPKEVVANGRLKLSVSGRYLFGGTMGGARYRFEVQRKPTSLCEPNHRNYKAGSSYYYPRDSVTWKHKTGNLDHTGKHTTLINLENQPGGHYPWPCLHSSEAEVTSSAFRSVTARKSVLQFPTNTLVGVKTQTPKKGRLRYHVQLFDMKWRKKSGQKVQVALYPIHRDYMSPDLERPFWKRVIDIQDSGENVSFNWPKKYKQHLGLLILTAKDKKNRESKTAVLVYRPPEPKAQEKRKASHKAESETSQAKPESSKPKSVSPKITIHQDKVNYLPGETAHITVTKRNVEGDAILIVEREKTFFKTTLQFDKNGVARVTLPIKSGYAPLVVLRAIGIKKKRALRGKHAPLVSTESNLHVSLKPFELEVGIKTDKKIYRPGERVSVNLQVKNKLGRKVPAQVVIMAVDEAVLRLTRYMLPNPLYPLLHQPAIQTMNSDSRYLPSPIEALRIHRDHSLLTLPKRYSGTGRLHHSRSRICVTVGNASVRGGVPSESRKRFLDTAWHTTVATDTNGFAEAEFSLPDNLTEYRLMAFAVDDKRCSGLGYSRLKVSLPLLTLPALPRFVRSGDRFLGAITIYNKSLPTGPAVVLAKVRNKGIRIVGPNHKSVRLRQGQDTRVHFTFKATHPAKTQLEFTVSSGNNTDTVIHPLIVKPAHYPEVTALSGSTKEAVLHEVDKLSGVRADFGELTIKLASSTLVGIEHSIQKLIEYPYQCLEQQGSRAIALLTQIKMITGSKEKSRQKQLHLLRHTLQSIIAMQRADGGFSYWPKGKKSCPWITAYALVVLHRVSQTEKTHGQSVCHSCIQKGIGYLEDILKEPKILGHLNWSTESFILYALSHYSGHSKMNLMNNKTMALRALFLFEKRAQRPLFSRALLLVTLSRLADNPKFEAGFTNRLHKSAANLVAEVGGALRVDGDWAYAEETLDSSYARFFHSNTRTTAMVLLSLLAAKPQHPMLLRLVRWFVGGRKKADFRNTQEAAWGLMAMEEYARTHEKHKPDFESGVWLGRKRLLQSMFRRDSRKWHKTTIPMAHLMQSDSEERQRLIIAKRGRGTLYYSARLRYARRTLPEKPRNHGFSVEKKIQVLKNDGKLCKTPKRPQLGDTVLVTIKVNSSEPRRYVVIEDPLPAGLEPLDLSLATAGQSFGAHHTWQKVSFWNHRELRDDRVLFFRDYMSGGPLVYRYLARVTTAGKFHTPPAQAKEMYTPEVFGHSAASPVIFKLPSP